MRFISHIVSGIFHPVLIPLYAYALTRFAIPNAFQYLPYEVENPLLLRIILNGMVFPVLSILILRGLGWVKDFHFEERESRHGVFILFMFFYIWLYFSFKLQGDMYSPLLLMALLGGMISSILAFVVNLIITKVSIHAIGAGYLISLFIIFSPLAEVNLFYPLIIAVALGGLVGTARLILKAHTLNQVYFGYFIGILSVMIALRITI